METPNEKKINSLNSIVEQLKTKFKDKLVFDEGDRSITIKLDNHITNKYTLRFNFHTNEVFIRRIISICGWRLFLELHGPHMEKILFVKADSVYDNIVKDVELVETYIKTELDNPKQYQALYPYLLELNSLVDGEEKVFSGYLSENTVAVFYSRTQYSFDLFRYVDDSKSETIKTTISVSVFDDKVVIYQEENEMYHTTRLVNDNPENITEMVRIVKRSLVEKLKRS